MKVASYKLNIDNNMEESKKKMKMLKTSTPNIENRIQKTKSKR